MSSIDAQITVVIEKDEAGYYISNWYARCSSRFSAVIVAQGSKPCDLCSMAFRGIIAKTRGKSQIKG